MTKRTLGILACCGLVSTPAIAGVLMEMETVDGSGNASEHTTFRAQAGKIRMDDVESTGEPGMSTIFLGDQFIVLDHKKKKYFVIDQAMLDEVGTKMDAAMKQMHEQLASLPPEQRAMAERMMKGRMGVLPDDEPEPELRVEKIGSGKWQSETCAQYAVYKGAEKQQEVCAAALDDIEGAEEAMRAFQSMAAYIRKMTESLPMRAATGPNPGELIEKVGGFPVITTNYRMGNLATTTTLKAADEQSLDDGIFAVPDGYQREDLMRGH